MKRWLLALFWAFGLHEVAEAQSFPFLIRVEQPNSAVLVANGGGISVNAAVGRTETLTVTLTYAGQGSGSIRSNPTLSGSSAFSILESAATPAGVASGQTYRFVVRYAPQNTQAASAQITMPVSETILTASGNSITTQSVFILQLAGVTPDFNLGFIGTELQNFTPLRDGDAIAFPATALDAFSNVIVSVTNRGSGSGFLRSVTLSGGDFQFVGLPSLPASFAANTELRFGLRFQPKAEGPRTAQLTLLTDTGTFTVSLNGEAFRTRFAYEIINGSTLAEILPGATINLGEALPNEILSTQVLVRNVNPIAVALPSIVVFGQGFVLSENPGVRTLRPGETVSFFVSGQVAQIGTQRGRLRVGDDAFDLLLTGSGALFRYSYTTSGSDPVALTPNGSVFFPPTRIGSTETVNFVVRNTGISDATLVNIATTDLAGAFSLTDLPALPARLRPGQELSFTVRFRPNAPGLSNGGLRLDGAAFVLSGTASSLPPLPGYRFSLSSGNIGALEQPQLGLQLNSPYPSPLSGTLTLTQEAAGFANDPSVRFANGAQTINFTIAANATQAVFANGLNTIRFQTGSVAGLILLRASFSVGGANLQDDNPELLRLTVVAAAPRVLAATLSPVGANTLLLNLTGLTLSRSLTRLDLELTPAAGVTLSGTRFSINLTGESLAWFRSNASQSTGGVFSLQLPLNLSTSRNTTGTSASNLLESIASIQVVLANETGPSAPLTVQLR